MVILWVYLITLFMSKTIDDFQNFFDKDKQKETFLLCKAINKSIQIIQSSFKTENISYNGYLNELQHVILVILNNARDILISEATINPEISINLESTQDGVFIKICDNAGGIKTEVIERIFEPYYTTKHKSQGRGLGLYISKMIIEDSFDGELNAHNSNNGACFIIKI